MGKIRVYELAKELGKDNKAVVEIIQGLGIEIKNQMSTLAADDEARVRAHFSPGGSARSSGSGSESSGAGARAATGPHSVIRRRGAALNRQRHEQDEESEPTASPASTPMSRSMSSSGAVARPAVRPGGSGPSSGHGSSGSGPGGHGSMGRPGEGSGMRGGGSGGGSSSGRMPDNSATDESGRPRESPAVGTRIELPANTRRLPGGMAQRITTPEPPRPSASSGASGGPSRGPGPGGGSSRPQGGGPQVSARSGGSMSGPSMGPRGTPVVPAGSPRSSSGPGPTVTVRPSSSGEMRPSGPGSAPSGSAPPATPDNTTSEAPAVDPGGGRRVVRNEDGVIVGAAPQRSEPRIIGFIPLQQARKRQQVIITDATEEDKRGRASQRKQREERAQAQGRRRKMNRPVRGQRTGPGVRGTMEMSEEKKRIRVDEAIQVSDLAHQMGQKASVVLRQLWSMGMRGLTINHAIDMETAEIVAGEFGYTVENVAFQEDELLDRDDEGDGELRAPVVTLMGHVDHGKTSLLDKIREARVAAGEAGGITQHIGAYRVDTSAGPVVFLDTPGHEAFSAMRSRGAQVTDLIVLVVAADDGIMPTTIEAIKHANEAEVPIVVAINKVDKPEANPGRVKQALMEYGLVGEEFGGETSILEVSAKTGQGVQQLVENLALQAEILELRAAPEGRASGVVLEARIDKGRGPVATVLLLAGMLRRGDTVVANEFHGKVRQLFNDRGEALEEAGPSTPVEVLGLSGVPQAGDNVNVVEDERDAKSLISHRREQRKRKESVRSGPSIHELLQRRKVPMLKIVLRSDVQGSAQALKDALEALSTDKVKVEVIKAEVGQINETDVKYARAGSAVIFGFNVKTSGKAAPVAEAEGVEIFTFSVVYDATDKARELMIGLLEPEYREKEQGEAEVRALFPIPRLGVVAGCRVLKGIIQRTSHVRVVRAGTVLFSGTIHSLRQFKDDVKEVKDGHECGIVVDGFPQIQEGDLIQAFEVEAIPPTL